MLKYFPRILRVRRKNEEYAERNYLFQQCPGTLKGQCFEKIEWGVICLAKGEQFTIFIFWLSLKEKLLYAHTETTLNREISTESIFFSVNNNTNFKKV